MRLSEVRSYLQDENNTYNSKISIIKEHIPDHILQKWTVEVAKSVLHIYEEKYPNDTRVRDCITATELYLDGEISKKQLEGKRGAANNAAYDASAAADYAAYAATNAANVGYADAYAAYTVAYAAAYTAADAAYAANNSDRQKQLNIQLMVDLLVKKVKDTKVARKVYGEPDKIEDGYLVYNL